MFLLFFTKIPAFAFIFIITFHFFCVTRRKRNISSEEGSRHSRTIWTKGKFLPLAFPFFRSLIFASSQPLKLKSYHLSNYTFLITNRSFDLLLSKFSCNRWKLKISHFILFSNHNFFSAVQVDFFNIISMFSHFNSHVTTTQPQTSFFSAIL